MNRIATVAITLIATAVLAVSAFAQGKPPAPAQAKTKQVVKTAKQVTPAKKKAVVSKKGTTSHVWKAVAKGKTPKKPVRKSHHKHVIIHRTKPVRKGSSTMKATTHKSAATKWSATTKSKSATSGKKTGIPTKGKSKRSEVRRQ
jgi:hypothetical protein